MENEQQKIDNQDSKPILPYPINKPSFKVQDIFEDDGVDYTFTAEYQRLDSSNFRILLNKEKDTKRLQETLVKDKTRDRLEVDTAHDNFFNALVLRGWLKPGDDPEEEWDYNQVKELNIEQKIALNVKFLDCKSKVIQVTGAEKYSFLLNKDGHMIVEFSIGDPDDPIWVFSSKN